MIAPSLFILQTDASEYDLSTALIQNDMPVSFAIKTCLLHVETIYMPIWTESASLSVLALKNAIPTSMEDIS